MSNPAVYIRNADKRLLSPKDYAKESGVVLTRYFSTRVKAKRLNIPLFDRRGNTVFWGKHGTRKPVIEKEG